MEEIWKGEPEIIQKNTKSGKEKKSEYKMEEIQ